MIARETTKRIAERSANTYRPLSLLLVLLLGGWAVGRMYMLENPQSPFLSDTAIYFSVLGILFFVCLYSLAIVSTFAINTEEIKQNRGTPAIPEVAQIIKKLSPIVTLRKVSSKVN